MPANTTDLEKRLWDAADDLRANSKLKSSEYAMPVLGLIFLRYADYKFAQAVATLQATSQRRRRAIDKDDYQAKGVLYLRPEARFSTLLDTLKAERLVLEWRSKQQTRAAVRVTIKRALEDLPRAYTDDLYQQKCEVVYQHVYEAMRGQI